MTSRFQARIDAVLTAMVGARVMHRVPLGTPPIDHVVVAPAGVFAVTARARRADPSVDPVDPRWIAEALTAAGRLRRALGAPATALLVVRDPGADPWSRTVRGVAVVSDEMLSGFLRRAQARLDGAAVDALHARLVAVVADR